MKIKVKDKNWKVLNFSNQDAHLVFLLSLFFGGVSASVSVYVRRDGYG